MSFVNPVELPHLDWPARLGPDGKFVVNEQNSPADVAACVTNAVACPPGALLGNPSFGVPPALFQTIPLNTQAIVTAIQAIEPRVISLSADETSQAIVSGMESALSADLNLSIAGGVADTSVVQTSDGS